MALSLHSNQSNDVDAPLHLYELPDSCIASALVLTTPKDACRMAPVASWCRSLTSSDEVWASFLPADYRDILSRSPEGINLLQTSMSKKELYLRICDYPLLIDDGTKSFTLDKATGKKRFMLSAKSLSIIWGSTWSYWKFGPLPESRFNLVAELIMVCWLDIKGVINTKMLSPNTKYAAYLVFTLKSGFYGFKSPGEASVAFSGEGCENEFVDLDPDGAVAHSRTWRLLRERERRQRHMNPASAKASTSYYEPWTAKHRGDGWMEVKLGEIYVKGDEDADIEMKLAEIKGGNWKSGLCVEGIEIRAEEE